MPIFDYKCLNKDCSDFDTVKEKLQSKSEPLKKCDTCKEDTLEKQLSKSNFKLKGVGVFANGTN